jgi:stearoyl-CoA desaturase (delta-9 desaturase)
MAPNIVDGLNLTKVDANNTILEVPKVSEESKVIKSDDSRTTEEPEEKWFSLPKNIIWRNVIFISLFHALAVYGFITAPYIQRWKTFLWGNYIGIGLFVIM